jgi:hypothetical protein
MTLTEEIKIAMDVAGRNAEYKAARALLMGAEDSPERMEAIRYVGERLGLVGLLEESTPA